MTTSNASAGSAPCATGSVSSPIKGRNSKKPARPPVRKYQRHRCGARRRGPRADAEHVDVRARDADQQLRRPFSVDSVSRHAQHPGNHLPPLSTASHASSRTAARAPVRQPLLDRPGWHRCIWNPVTSSTRRRRPRPRRTTAGAPIWPSSTTVLPLPVGQRVSGHHHLAERDGAVAGDRHQRGRFHLDDKTPFLYPARDSGPGLAVDSVR